MATSQRATLDALNGRYLNGDTGRINEGYLNEAMQLTLANVKPLYDALSNTRRKPTSVAWEALVHLANEALKDDAYPDKPYTASSEHLKKWLNDYGRGYETIAETVDWITEQRKEG